MRRFASLVAVLVLAISLSACNDHFWDEECDIVVINGSSCRLRILVDGWEAFIIRPDDTRTVDDVAEVATPSRPSTRTTASSNVATSTSTAARTTTGTSSTVANGLPTASGIRTVDRTDRAVAFYLTMH